MRHWVPYSDRPDGDGELVPSSMVKLVLAAALGGALGAALGWFWRGATRTTGLLLLAAPLLLAPVAFALLMMWEPTALFVIAFEVAIITAVVARERRAPERSAAARRSIPR